MWMPSLSFSHPGGLDRTGGHFNRKTGAYHCHREPCVTLMKECKHPKVKCIEKEKNELKKVEKK